MKVILSHEEVIALLSELTKEILANYPDTTDLVFLGIQQGGVVIADEIMKSMKAAFPDRTFHYGQLDITFYRDDIRKEIMEPDKMNIPTAIENKIIILIDDVLFTGRTIKAALDAILDYGRPAKVELCVLIDRKEHRQFPIQPDYTGKVIKTEKKEKVKLITDEKGKKQVVLITD